MSRPILASVVLALVSLLAPDLSAQVPPGVTVLPIPFNFPGNGGITFSNDGATLFAAAFVDTPSGQVHSHPVTRDGTGHVTAFGTNTVVAAAPFIDQGLAFGPGGTLFWATFPINSLAQLPPGGTVTEFPLAPTGVALNTLSLAFIPPGFPNAGQLVITSYTTGQLNRIGLSPNGNGTFTPIAGSAVPVAGGLPQSSIQGIAYIPVGPDAGKIAAGEFSAFRISLVQLDQSTGLGFPSPASTASSNMIGATQFGPTLPRGICFDPLTNDLFMMQGGGGFIFRFSGTMTASPLSAPPIYSASSGSPAVILANVGSAFAGLPYTIAVSLSGSIPGVTFNGTLVPINPDAMTDFVIQAALAQHPQWVSFMGTLSAGGTATATFMRPGPISPAWVGVTATVSMVVTGTTTFATSASQVTVVP